jgi:glutathione S-transferase
MILFGSSISPFVRKVLAFAAEKGLELESKPLGMGSDDPDFLAASPFRKIPALQEATSTSPILARSSTISMRCGPIRC